MAVKPAGSIITVGAYDLIVSDIKYQFLTIPFDRLEFSTDRLRAAPNKILQRAIQVTLLGNTPAQIVIGNPAVSFDDVIPQYPDVTVTSSNFGNVKKKFLVKRYEIQGAPSLSANVDGVYATSATHINSLAVFDAHIQKSNSMNTEYDELIALQAETFSYLTTTGLSLSGDAIESTQTNMLITSFQPGVEYQEIIDDMGTSRVLKSYSLVIENRTIAALDA